MPNRMSPHQKDVMRAGMCTTRSRISRFTVDLPRSFPKSLGGWGFCWVPYKEGGCVPPSGTASFFLRTSVPGVVKTANTKAKHSNLDTSGHWRGVTRFSL